MSNLQPEIEKEGINDPIVDVLVEGPIHKTMVFFCQPEQWPGWLVVFVVLTAAIVSGLPWWMGQDSQAAGWAVMGTMMGMLVDTAVLTTLPQKRRSFGPWKAQLTVLTIPRLVVLLLLSLVSFWWPWAGLVLVALGAQAAITGAYGWGLIIEPFRLKLTHLTVTTNRLAAGSRPIRLLHLSDLHLEYWTQRETAVLQLAQEAAPDLIVITGDYVNLSYNQDPQTHQQVRQFLSQLAAPFGVYATLGSPPVDLRQEVVPLFEGLPITLMRHDQQVVDLGEGRQLVLLGMDCTHHLPTDRQRWAQLAAERSQAGPQVFLYHSPEIMPEVARDGVDLYLCGHTHGGQVRLPLIGPLLTSSQLGRRYVMGLYREGRTHLYISRGIGLEGLSAPRVRFLAPPEITLVTIAPAL